jgi:hypothetical protein
MAAGLPKPEKNTPDKNLRTGLANPERSSPGKRPRKHARGFILLCPMAGTIHVRMTQRKRNVFDTRKVKR